MHPHLEGRNEVRAEREEAFRDSLVLTGKKNAAPVLDLNHQRPLPWFCSVSPIAYMKSSWSLNFHFLMIKWGHRFLNFILKLSC